MQPGRITKSSAIAALQDEDVSYDRARETLKAVRADATGTLELDDWIEVNIYCAQVAKVTNPHMQLASRAQSSPTTLSKGTRRGTLTFHNTGTEASHTIDEDESSEFTNFINTVLARDTDVGGRLPIPIHTMQVFDECRDGLM